MEYKRSWIQHVNRMPRNRLPRVMKHYCPTGRRNRGRPLKRLLGTWDRNGLTGGPTAWQIYDDNDSLHRIVKHYCPTGRRNYGRPLKTLLDTWDRNGSTSGPIAWQISDDDDDDDDGDDISQRCSALKWVLIFLWHLLKHKIPSKFSDIFIYTRVLKSP